MWTSKQVNIVVAQLLSSVRLFATPQTAEHQASIFFTDSQGLRRLMLTELVMPSNYLILCCPLLFLPSIFPSIRVFSRESVLHIKWPKDWSFSFCISPSSEHSGWFPLGLTGLISWQYKGISGVFSSTAIWNYQFFRCSAFFGLPWWLSW